jgi:putative ABC transport system ATP-binding protein
MACKQCNGKGYGSIYREQVSPYMVKRQRVFTAIGLLYKSIKMSDYCIRTEQLVKNYGSGVFDNAVIKNVSISIPNGEFSVIMGNSGSGKSTLLYLLSGLDAASSGKIWIKNIPVHNRSQKDLAIIRRKMIGFVFQDHNLVPNLTIHENILVAGFLVRDDRKLVQQHAESLMEDLGILQLAKRYPSQVSGGELQRAAIARALINKPLILLADEPTGNLNSEASEKVLECFSELNRKGQTIVMVTHDLKSACRGSRILFIKDGTIPENHSYYISKNHPNPEDELFNWLKNMGW